MNRLNAIREMMNIVWEKRTPNNAKVLRDELTRTINGRILSGDMKKLAETIPEIDLAQLETLIEERSSSIYNFYIEVFRTLELEIPEAADYLKVSSSTLRRIITGEIPRKKYRPRLIELLGRFDPQYLARPINEIIVEIYGGDLTYFPREKTAYASEGEYTLFDIVPNIEAPAISVNDIPWENPPIDTNITTDHAKIDVNDLINVIYDELYTVVDAKEHRKILSGVKNMTDVEDLVEKYEALQTPALYQALINQKNTIIADLQKQLDERL